jgi:hypothetical protein
MNLIGREELKEKLDRGDKFKLANALGEWAFEAKRIPGSINIRNMQDAKKMLDPSDDIVIHCSNPSCPASIIGYQTLERLQYQNGEKSLPPLEKPILSSLWYKSLM